MPWPANPAHAQAFPILDFVALGDDDILTALADADAPAAWWHVPIVRALYILHWGACPQWQSCMMYHGCFCEAGGERAVLGLVGRGLWGTRGRV